MSTNSASEDMRAVEEAARLASTDAVVRNIEVALMIGHLTRRCKNFGKGEPVYVALELDRFKTRRVYRVGYEVEEGTWWVEVPLPGSDGVFDYEYFDTPNDMPPHIGDKVLVLCTAPDAFVQGGVGRRISADRFWVYIEPEEQSENQGGSDGQA